MSATTKRTRLQRTLGEARSMLRDLSTNCAAMEEPEIVEELGETIEELIAALCEISDAHPVDVLAAFSADDISEMIR